MRAEISISGRPRRPDGLPRIEIAVPDIGSRHDLLIDFDALFGESGRPRALALDFLLISAICYGIDCIIPRRTAGDGWTRVLDVDIPVSAPGIWTETLDDLAETLRFVTGDEWRVTFRKSERPLFRQPTSRRESSLGTAVPGIVCLLSGGVDSLVGAINLIAAGPRCRLLFVGHHGSGGPEARAQREVYAGLKRAYSRRRTELRQVYVAVRPRSHESSYRSRSLLFIGLGVFSACSTGRKTPLVVPENGFIAANVPLTPSRMGSLSTRTTHPYFLDGVRRVLAKAGIASTITNPFADRTKGEVVTDCADEELLKAVVTHSVSCAHPTRRQSWVRRTAPACGYCIPCLFRRAALWKAGLDDGLQYGFDICAGELRLDDSKAADLRALLDYLAEEKSAADLMDDVVTAGPIPPGERHVIADTVQRGFAEMRSFLAKKGAQLLKEYRCNLGRLG